jgi:aspartate/methionine/tyrosine aminotransferase
MQIAPFKLERFFDQHEFSAPFLLCSSDCESFSIQELLAFEKEEANWQNVWLGYTESTGNKALRDEISKLYSKIDSKEVLVHAGAEEAIFNFMNILLSKNDHIIVHTPCYQSLTEVATSIGCKVTKWIADEANSWELDLDFLQKSIQKNTKLIIVNCPHNPTGYVMQKDKLNQLIEIARENNIILFSDEVYRLLEYDIINRLPAACDLYENAVSLGVVSKSFGLAGLRIGWIATQNQTILKKMAAFKDYTSICNSAPSEFLATLALKNQNNILERNQKIVLENLSHLSNFMKKYQEFFTWNPPKGGTVSFPRINKDSNQFCQTLLEIKGVLLAPSENFNYGNNNFRIGIGRINFVEGLIKFDEYLSETL